MAQIPWIKGKHHTETTKRRISLALKGRPTWNKGLKTERKTTAIQCKFCSGIIYTYPYNTGRKFCSRVCYWKWNSKNKVGENHPNWIKDRETLIKNVEKHERNNKEYYHWRWLVKNRDGSVCKINNIDCGEELEVHHILSWRDYPELRHEVNNGITLCQAHHPRKRAEEKRLIPFFQGLVSASNILA